MVLRYSLQILNVRTPKSLSKSMRLIGLVPLKTSDICLSVIICKKQKYSGLNTICFLFIFSSITFLVLLSITPGIHSLGIDNTLLPLQLSAFFLFYSFGCNNYHDAIFPSIWRVTCCADDYTF